LRLQSFCDILTKVFLLAVSMEHSNRGCKKECYMKCEFLGRKNEPFGEEDKKGLKFFFKMGEIQRLMVKQWYLDVVPQSYRQKEFLRIVDEAIERIDYDFRIATLEPSMDLYSQLYFKEDSKVEASLFLYEWAIKAEEFYPELNSRLATLHELFFWYAYRIAKGYWTLEYVCDSPRPGHETINASGIEELGGFCDGIGNTYKVVKNRGTYFVCGGFSRFKRGCFPAGTLVRMEGIHDPYDTFWGQGISTGVVVLLK